MAGPLMHLFHRWVYPSEGHVAGMFGFIVKRCTKCGKEKVVDIN